MALELTALVVLGLMCGSELNIAAFGHPAIARQSLETHILMRSSFAILFGRVMPFWMAGSTLLNLLLLLPFAHLGAANRRFATMAFAIQVGAVVFSLIFPVPINNRIAKWTPQSLPRDWSALEHRWDLYHAFRTGWLVVAFVLLSLGIVAH
jgi:uncharacterized membrane protein